MSCSSGEGDVEEDGGDVIRIVTGIIAGDIIREEIAGLGLGVVAGLGYEGVEVVWLKDL